jgi:hypothetical protein
MNQRRFIRGLQGANMDLGMTALRFAGLEAAEGLTGPVIRRPVQRTATGAEQGGQWFFLSPSTVAEAIVSLDAAFKALDADIRGNVRRAEFLSGWAAQLSAWSTFKADNDTALKLLIHGTGPVWRQAEVYRTQLSGWRDAYAKETGFQPSGPGPSSMPLPKPQEPEPFWTPTKIAIAVLVAGALGYATYRYWQSATKTSRRLRGLAEEYALRRATGGLTGRAGASKMLAEGD